MSFPNQKTIIIHQSDQIPFLKIGIEELMDAFKTIKTPSTFILYLYLASNKDGYKLELSKEAFANATGLSKSSYHRAVEHLTKLGYIYEDNCGRLNFATKPKLGLRKAIQNWEEDSANLERPIVKDETTESQNCTTSISELNTEIDNKYNKDNKEIIDSANLPDSQYLFERVSPLGQCDGVWFEDLIEGFWDLSKEGQALAISFFFPFNSWELDIITSFILNKEKRKQYYRTS